MQDFISKISDKNVLIVIKTCSASGGSTIRHPFRGLCPLTPHQGLCPWTPLGDFQQSISQTP